MFTRRFVLACVAILAVGILSRPAPADAAIGEDAKAMVQALADGALKVLAETDGTRADRDKRLRTLLLAHFNVRAIGRFVIASHWRTASKQQRRDFLKVFESYVVKTYTVQLGQYAGEKFKVLAAQPDKRGVVVISEILPPNRSPVVLKWRVRKSKSGDLKVVDVVVENISMALTQRQEFASVIQQRGGTLDGLVAALQEKIEELDARNAAKSK